MARGDFLRYYYSINGNKLKKFIKDSDQTVITISENLGMNKSTFYTNTSRNRIEVHFLEPICNLLHIEPKEILLCDEIVHAWSHVDTDKIRKILRDRNISRERIANSIGVHTLSLKSWLERPGLKNVEILRSISNFLKIDYKEFILEEEDMNKEKSDIVFIKSKIILNKMVEKNISTFNIYSNSDLSISMINSILNSGVCKESELVKLCEILDIKREDVESDKPEGEPVNQTVYIDPNKIMKIAFNKGYTMLSLANKIGTRKFDLNKWLTKSGQKRMYVVERIASALEVDSKELIADEFIEFTNKSKPKSVLVDIRKVISIINSNILYKIGIKVSTMKTLEDTDLMIDDKGRVKLKIEDAISLVESIGASLDDVEADK